MLYWNRALEGFLGWPTKFYFLSWWWNYAFIVWAFLVSVFCLTIKRLKKKRFTSKLISNTIESKLTMYKAPTLVLWSTRYYTSPQGTYLSARSIYKRKQELE